MTAVQLCLCACIGGMLQMTLSITNNVSQSDNDAVQGNCHLCTRLLRVRVSECSSVAHHFALLACRKSLLYTEQ